MSVCRDTCCTGRDDTIVVKVISQKTVRAKKDYKCADCGKDIHAGNIYWRIAILDDGSVYSYKSHSPGGECQYEF